jgi:hypothetical protein
MPPQKKADDIESMGSAEKKRPSPSAFEASTAHIETPAPSYQSWRTSTSRAMISSTYKDASSDSRVSFEAEIGQPARTVDELNRMLESPEVGPSRPTSQHLSVGTTNSKLRPLLLSSASRPQHHIRDDSVDSTISLPPPPRANRSPSPIARRPTLAAFLRPSPLDRRPTIKEVAYYDVPAPQPPQRSDSLMISPGYLTYKTKALASPPPLPSPNMPSPASEYAPTEAWTPMTPRYHYPDRTRSSRVSRAAVQEIVPPTPASARSHLRTARSVPSMHASRDTMPPSTVHRNSRLFYQ